MKHKCNNYKQKLAYWTSFNKFLKVDIEQEVFFNCDGFKLLTNNKKTSKKFPCLEIKKYSFIKQIFNACLL